MSSDFVKVRGTELLASDPRDLYRQKLARITLEFDGSVRRAAGRQGPAMKHKVAAALSQQRRVRRLGRPRL